MPPSPKWPFALALLAVSGPAWTAAPASAQTTPRSAAAASAPIDLHRGVAVVAVGKHSVDATWALASRVYADPLLRPARLDDATARVLAGEAPSQHADARLVELANARSAMKLDDPIAARLASSISADLEGASLLFVFAADPSHPRARLFASSTRSFVTPDLWMRPDASDAASWDSSVAWLHAHAVASRTTVPSPAPSPAKSVLTSGWFWGAIGAAAGAAVLAFTIRRDDTSDTIHLQGRVGP
ncbi:MAG: hypothetical protein HY898_30910 [Deltaproteobacteria bacterium]|nr:hypothetical protein [Deltaproteobacteria bacterium]